MWSEGRGHGARSWWTGSCPHPGAQILIVLAEGTIIEEGDHDSLLAQGGRYADLYNTYSRHQSLAYIERSRELATAGSVGSAADDA
jgi:hypothetical protein